MNILNGTNVIHHSMPKITSVLQKVNFLTGQTVFFYNFILFLPAHFLLPSVNGFLLFLDLSFLTGNFSKNIRFK